MSTIPLNEHTTVRELLAAYPRTFPVLLKHGMCEDCQADPPPVPLGHFASKHCGGDVAGLLEELRFAIAENGGEPMSAVRERPR